MQPHLFRLHPPYTETITVTGNETSFDRGSIILIRPFADSSWTSIDKFALHYAVTAPTVSPILWLDLVSFDQRLRLAVLSSQTSVSAVIGSAIPTENILREQITDPADFHTRLVRWLQQIRNSKDDDAWCYLALIAQHAQHYTTLHQLIGDHRGSGSKWQREFRHADLGTPGVWFQVLRVVRAAMAMQRDPYVSVQQFASDLRYYDAAALRHRLSEVIGSGVDDIRRRLGWTWMMSQALRRAGLAEQRPANMGTGHVMNVLSNTLQYASR